MRAEAARGLARPLRRRPGPGLLFELGHGGERSGPQIRRSGHGPRKFVACRGGYHGKTLGALSVTDGAKFRAAFEPLPWEVAFVPYGDVDALDAALDDGDRRLHRRAHPRRKRGPPGARLPGGGRGALPVARRSSHRRRDPDRDGPDRILPGVGRPKVSPTTSSPWARAWPGASRSARRSFRGGRRGHRPRFAHVDLRRKSFGRGRDQGRFRSSRRGPPGPRPRKRGASSAGVWEPSVPLSSRTSAAAGS